MDIGDPGGLDTAGGTNEMDKPLNKSQSTLIHVGDRKRDERMGIQMSAKWQESSATEMEKKRERQTETHRWVK